MESEPALTPREKSPLSEAQKDRTHDAASSRTVSPAHNQLSYSGPRTSLDASYVRSLTLNFLVAEVSTLNTKTHSSENIAEFFFENVDVESICYCNQRMKSKLSLSSERVETKLCKPCTSFT